MSRAAIEDDQVVIRIPLAAIPQASAIAFERHYGSADRTSVTDVRTFARELVNTLNAEKENGDTMVTDMLDQAVIRASGNGAEGLSE